MPFIVNPHRDAHATSAGFLYQGKCRPAALNPNWVAALYGPKVSAATQAIHAQSERQKNVQRAAKPIADITGGHMGYQRGKTRLLISLKNPAKFLFPSFSIVSVTRVPPRPGSAVKPR
ncbi:MAG: hypothetical protein ABSD20_22005 [Terriglobales bacterium]|jgi:hypothetical protein